MLTDDELKAKIGPDVYDALVAKFGQSPAAVQQEWLQWVKGGVKSVTNWFGALLIAWPAVQPQLQPFLEDTFGPHFSKWAISLIGAGVILLRIKTNQSLKAKGA